MNYCKNCGVAVDEHDQFCTNCGVSLPGERSREGADGHSRNAGDRSPDSGAGRSAGGRDTRSRDETRARRRESAADHSRERSVEPPGGTRDQSGVGNDTPQATGDSRSSRASERQTAQQSGGSQTRRAASTGQSRARTRSDRRTRGWSGGGRETVGRADDGQRQVPDVAEDDEGGSDPVQAAFTDEVDLYDIATWEVRSPLDRFAARFTGGLRRGQKALVVLVAAVLLLAQVGTAVFVVAQEPLLGALAVTSIVPALAMAGYLWYDDPTEREPFVPLAATFVLAIAFATIAAVVNTRLAPAFELFGIAGVVLFYFVVVGPVEELVKLLAVRAYAYQNDAFQTIIDGVVYGAVAGLGFAAIENFTYIATVYFEAGSAETSQLQSAASVTAQRLFAGPGHVVFSSWAGFYLGLAKFNPENRGPIVVKGLLIAVFIHATYNTTVTVLPAVLPLSGLAIFGVIVVYHAACFGLLYRKVRTYQNLYRQRVTDPVGQRGD